MVKPISKHTQYITAAARFKDLVYIIGKDRGLVRDDVNHSRFIGFDAGNFGHNGDRNWNAVAIGVVKKPKEKMVAVGADGPVFSYVGGAAVDEKIDPAPASLRGLGVVGGFAYACGMKRQVYKRADEKTWVAMHAPAPKENAGFEAIAGFSDNEIYAVGWNGEIWEWNGSAWKQAPSLTNLILTSVCIADEAVYSAGQNGTLLHGRHDQWKVISTNTKEDFWSVAWFNGKLYVASLTNLYTYENDKLVPVNFGADRPNSFGNLTHAEGVLWSVGDSDVFMYDGNTWQRID
jgi:hypothetical protein